MLLFVPMSGADEAGARDQVRPHDARHEQVERLLPGAGPGRHGRGAAVRLLHPETPRHRLAARILLRHERSRTGMLT